MRSLFNSKFKITQEFANKLIVDGKDYYAQFGLNGHEGIDLIPTGTVWDVLCLEDGVVVKDIDDAVLGKNYGKNVTIWHPLIKKATQNCHLASNDVSMGQRLKRGDKLGVMGATGNTTGAHVHLNLFMVDNNGIRLFRDNGYFGGIDPLPFLQEETLIVTDMIFVPKPQFEDFERVKNGWNQIREKLNVEDNVTVVVGEIDKLINYQDAVLQKDKQLVDANTKMTELDKSLAQLHEVNSKLIEDNKNLGTQVNKQSKIIQGQEGDITILSEKVKQLKENVAQPIVTGWRKFLINLLLKL